MHELTLRLFYNVAELAETRYLIHFPIVFKFKKEKTEKS